MGVRLGGLRLHKPPLGELYEIRLFGQERPRARVVRIPGIPGDSRSDHPILTASFMARIAAGAFRAGTGQARGGPQSGTWYLHAGFPRGTHLRHLLPSPAPLTHPAV